MKKWLKLSIVTNPIMVEAIADFLIGVIGAGVEIGVDEHIESKVVNGFVEKENPGRQEIFDTVEQVKGYLKELSGIFKTSDPELSWQIIEEEDWSQNWKKHFLPFAIIPGLIIAPTWEEYNATNPDERVIVMDPGMAFGTGHHATTSLALQFLADELKKPTTTENSVLDVGTGTGILAMAAGLMGAAKVVAIDNDIDAVMAAMENVERNKLSTIISASGKPLEELQERFTIVVANIIFDVLQQIALDLYRVTEAQGALILSGILHGEQARQTILTFEKIGFHFLKEEKRGEWAALLFRKI